MQAAVEKLHIDVLTALLEQIEVRQGKYSLIINYLK